MTAERPLPALLSIWRSEGLVWSGGGALLIFLALTVLWHEWGGLRWRGAAGNAALIASATLLVVGVGIEWYVRRAFARSCWVHRPGEGLVVTRGAWWHKEIWLPVSRLQHLDVVRGPLERHHGVATLALFTAGYHQHCVRLEGMDPERALALRDTLLAETRAHRAATLDHVAPA